MFQQTAPKSALSAGIQILELIFHSVVRSVRSSHNNAVIALFNNILQTLVMVGAFYALFSLMGARSMALRGDFMIYLMSGVFLFMAHSKTVMAVVGSEGPTDAMMQHAPMNTAIAFISAAIGALYIQVLTILSVLTVYHVAFNPVEIDQPAEAFAMFLLAWLGGAGVGLVLLALKPWFPTFTDFAAIVYRRANMVFSGKMFVANMLPGYMLAIFDWNPLFHCIDQARGYAFINYFPRNTSWEYAMWVTMVLILIGLMGEFYARKHASFSWGARR